ncbi:O-antigen ligase family protein [Patescibacteria group bacterium]|nr:O-antigen ligase family protein [Patescibacteria group bacterium]
MNSSKAKNITILLAELAVIFLMVFGVVPREASLFLTGLMIFYFIFAPVKDSLWVFIASIPLFIALPLTENFDYMANWRILLVVLFLVLFFRQGVLINKENLKHGLIEYLAGVFLIIGALSLFVADDLWIGAKKIIFLINIFLLFLIIRNLINKDKKAISEIANALKVAVGLTLSIGFTQLIAVFFIPLYSFWHFWDRQVISVFYGQNLSELLSYSNTWFSYYAYQLPTLRMFSIFPDSHSFAFFCILSTPFFLAAIFTKRARYFFLIACLMAIIFSGSRGAWVSALGALFVFLCVGNWKKKAQLIIGCLIIFFLLFPIASGVLLLSERTRTGIAPKMETISFFERARSIADFAETSVRGRLEIWQRTIDSIAARPVLGVGIGNYPLVLNEEMSSVKRGASAHNLYLDVAAEMGIFALLVLLAIFWQIIKKLWLIFQDKKEIKDAYLQSWASFFFLALIWVLGYSLFDVVLLNDKVLLFFMANLGLLYASFGLNQSSNLQR